MLVASQDGLLIDILVVVFTVAFYAAVVFVAVGVLLLPFAAAGWLLRIRTLRRAWLWWLLPVLAPGWAAARWDRFTRPRDPDRYRTITPERLRDELPESDERWVLAKAAGALLSLAAGLVAVVFALVYWHEWLIEPIADSGRGELVGMLAAVATTGAVVWSVVLAKRYPRDARPASYRYVAGVAAAVCFFTWTVLSSTASSNRLVEDYCKFGAVSDAQLAGCTSHVTAQRVRELDTPAAQFAIDGSSDAQCGDGSGPFCEGALQRRLYEDQDDRGPGER